MIAAAGQIIDCAVAAGEHSIEYRKLDLICDESLFGFSVYRYTMASSRTRSRHPTVKPPEPLIKVTLECLKGITLRTQERHSEKQPFIDISDLCKGDIHKKDEGPRVPHVTAAVSFSGSANDMQVGSSSLCPRTGILVVQSEPATLVSMPDDADQKGDDSFPLVAHWDVGNNGGTGGSSATGPAKKPHLTIRLPSRDPKLPSVSLEQMNRDCNVVPRVSPGLQDTDLSSEDGEEGIDGRSEARGPSVVWSASGAGMPEIIELNVSLMVGTESLVADETDRPASPTSSCSSWRTTHAPQEGIAYLVFFGHDKVSTTMDLPVKRLPSQKVDDEHEGGPMVTLEDEAMLRIRVDVFPEGKDEGLITDSVYSKSLLNSFVGRKRLEPILQQLRRESDQQQRADAMKAAAAQRSRIPTEEPKSGLGFCAGDVSFFSILKEMSEVVRHCDDGAVYVPSGDSAASTLDTAASLDI